MSDRGFELEIVIGKGRGRRIPVGTPHGITIGRDPSCELVLDDVRISRRHARLEVGGGLLRVVDLGSHNGLFVGGKRVDAAPLRPGDEFQLGDHVLRIHAIGDVPPAPAADIDATALDRGTAKLPGARPAVRVPAAIGPYSVLGILAEGGMGTVFLARRDQGPRVAVKILRSDFLADEDMRNRFEQEIRLSLQLQHPHIVRYLDAGRDAEGSYLVAEYVEGLSTRELLVEGPFEIDRALRWAREIADALVHAHERRILHRDLKPGNLLVETATDRIRILDFGLGRALDESNSRLTFTGQSMGTAQFAAPEQLFNAKTVDARADVYGLGACLYAFLTGLPPVRSRQTVKVMKEMLEEPLHDLRQLRPDVPEWLATLVEKALARDRSIRHASASELLAALG